MGAVYFRQKDAAPTGSWQIELARNAAQPILSAKATFHPPKADEEYHGLAQTGSPGLTLPSVIREPKTARWTVDAPRWYCPCSKRCSARRGLPIASPKHALEQLAASYGSPWDAMQPIAAQPLPACPHSRPTC